jgi:hypothetical protein
MCEIPAPLTGSTAQEACAFGKSRFIKILHVILKLMPQFEIKSISRSDTPPVSASLLTEPSKLVVCCNMAAAYT